MLPKFKHISLLIKTWILYTFSKIRAQFHSCHTPDLTLQLRHKHPFRQLHRRCVCTLLFLWFRSKMPTMRHQQSCITSIFQQCQKRHWNVVSLNVTEGKKPQPRLRKERNIRNRKIGLQWQNISDLTAPAESVQICILPIPFSLFC